MEFIQTEPDSYRFLFCKDVDSQSVSRLTEKYVPNDPIFDAIVVLGPFIHEAMTTREEIAVGEGDMSSLIAQFENIVCRVVYLPSETDPTNSLLHQLHLTPNSVNIHARELHLATGLRILGFTEKSSGLENQEHVEDDEDEDNTADITLQSGTSTTLIKEILEAATPVQSFGIFALSCKYSHTLNQFLFHMPEDLKSSGIKLCLIATEGDEASRLPSKFGGLSIVGLKSLRDGGHYVVVDLQRNNESGVWSVVKQEAHVV